MIRSVLPATCLALALGGPAFAGAPPYLPVQGYLSDPAGAPIEGQASLQIGLYAAMSGGAALFGPERHEVDRRRRRRDRRCPARRSSGSRST